MSVLSWIKLLETLSEKEKNELSLFCQKRHLESWEILFKEWEDASVMYILVSGTMNIYTWSEWDKLRLWKVVAEEILGEMALFGGDNIRMATAEAKDSCELLAIMSFSLKELIKDHPILLEKIKNIIEERVVDNKITNVSM